MGLPAYCKQECNRLDPEQLDVIDVNQIAVNGRSFWTAKHFPWGLSVFRQRSVCFRAYCRLSEIILKRKRRGTQSVQRAQRKSSTAGRLLFGKEKIKCLLLFKNLNWCSSNLSNNILFIVSMAFIVIALNMFLCVLCVLRALCVFFFGLDGVEEK